MSKLFFIFLLTLFTYSNAVSTRESSSYIAGVVEFNPILGKNVFDLVNRNLAQYLKFISLAKKQNVDILVFPEATLNRNFMEDGLSRSIGIEVPHGDEKILPCNEKEKYSKVLTEISCAAQLESMYIVVNVAEIAYCNKTSRTPCSTDETVLFNTNVVFDRDGVVISRYRKVNLFGEPGFIPSIDKELGVFETDFGVKFGHFICFDLLFQIPAVQTIEKLNIQNIIFPTMWFSEMPFLTAVQIQQGFAYAHNVNFLAAGANGPWVGSTGTGVYSGVNGSLIAVMNGVNKSQLLVAEVPKVPNSLKSFNQTPRATRLRTEDLVNGPETMDKLYLKRENLDIYTSQLIDEVKEHQFINLTHNNIECHFHISLNTTFFQIKSNTSHHYRYRAMVYDGPRTYDNFTDGGIINCALVACTDTTLASCGKRFDSYASFKPIYQISQLEIAAMVPIPKKNEAMGSYNIVYHPVTLDTTILPLSVSSFDYHKVTIEGSTNKQLLKMTLKRPQTELLTFGIMGRFFDGDARRNHKSPASANVANFWFVCGLIFINYIMLVLKP